MSMGWIRLHRQILESAIFADAELLKLWIWLLTRASSKCRHISLTTGRGSRITEIEPGQCIIGRERSAVELGWNPSTFRNRMAKLAELGMISIVPDTHWSLVSITNWKQFQRKGDESRTGKGQAKDNQETGKGQAKDRLRTDKGQAKDTNKNGKNDKKEEKGESASGKSAPYEVVDTWNRLTNSKCTLTGGREQAIAKRLKDKFFSEQWLNGIEKLAGSPFLRGENERKWKATLDWFLKPQNFLKVIEGNFDDSAKDSREDCSHTPRVPVRPTPAHDLDLNSREWYIRWPERLPEGWCSNANS